MHVGGRSGEMAVFASVASQGSLSAAARALGLTPSAISRIVARIERGLRPGAIVLLHEGAAHGRNVETVSLLLDRLDALGYPYWSESDNPAYLSFLAEMPSA